MQQARIKTTFGEIVISYSNLEELTKELEKVPSAISLVQSKTTGLAPTASRKAKPGYEELYDFESNGRLRLLRKPASQVALVAFALWANEPEPLQPSDLELVTGISEVVKSVLSQTNNRKYFVRRDDGRYGLSPDGSAFVSTKVAPSLKSSN